MDDSITLYRIKRTYSIDPSDPFAIVQSLLVFYLDDDDNVVVRTIDIFLQGQVPKRRRERRADSSDSLNTAGAFLQS